ncbi:hypothetical protein GH733_013159 [Mirounga leonina]|nr:hypothetical protein GH733_013159 [Mirounga leonina]
MPGIFHRLWVPGVALGQPQHPRLSLSAGPLHRTLQAKEPLARSLAQTQRAVQSFLGRTPYQCAQCCTMNEWMNDENYKAFEVIENLFEYVLSHLTDSTIQESYSIFLTGLLAEEWEQLYYMQDSVAELRAAFALRLGQLQGEQTKQDPLMGGSELQCTWNNWWSNKVFGPGTLLRITVAEIKIHKAGTYLCLLEDFFPDIIKIDWQEKDGKTILKSQQGDTMKTKDTYMKFSWLTVTEASMDKEHKCIVNHESDKAKVNQEILFPSINKDTLQLQLMNTSAYYTYLLLLVKSLVYSTIIAICLLGRPAPYGNGKSS